MNISRKAVHTIQYSTRDETNFTTFTIHT